jgi:diguanylate cyclase (GGDEF)-like protein/PAS domain S-box-containing protein
MQRAQVPPHLPPPAAGSDWAADLLGQVFQHSPIGIAVIAHDGRFVHVNPAYCGLHGYQREQMLGHAFTMIVPPEQQAQVLQRHRAFLDADAPLKGEFDVQRADGRRFSTLVESVRLPSLDGSAQRLVYVVDITERRLIEQALQASQQFLHSVLDGLTAHVCVLDEQGIILAVNRAWRAFAADNGGAGSDLHEGANYLQVCARALVSQLPDGAETAVFTGLLRDVLAGQRQQFELDYPCHSPTEQRWYVVRVARMAGTGTGTGAARVVVAHDNVTALKQVQNTLHQSEALLRDLTASLPGAVFRLVHRPGDGWRFSYFSAGIAALFGISPEAACADIRALGRLILPEDKPGHDRSIQQAVAARQGWEHDYRIRATDGVLKWVHARATPKLDDDGDMVWTGVLTDVSDRKRLEAVLVASEDKYRTLFETAPQGMVYQDRDGRITSANPAAQRILGLTLDQLQGRSSIDPRWQALREDGSPFPGDQHPAMVALRCGEPVKDVLMGVSVPDRGHAWLLVNAIPLYRNGEIEEVYASFEDITQRVLLSKELHLQATTDFLTGAANRRRLMERLQFEVDRVRRHPATHCSVLSIDLDLFKRVNDSRGHAAGDAVLCHVARLMQGSTRHNDLVARSGGEEFMLLLPDTDGPEALALADRLRARIAAESVEVLGQAVPQTVSIGIGLIAATDTTPDAVLARADAALYEAKNAGRNTVRLAGLG